MSIVKSHFANMRLHKCKEAMFYSCGFHTYAESFNTPKKHRERDTPENISPGPLTTLNVTKSKAGLIKCHSLEKSN